jgi:hypothetical protein
MGNPILGSELQKKCELDKRRDLSAPYQDTCLEKKELIWNRRSSSHHAPNFAIFGNQNLEKFEKSWLRYVTKKHQLRPAGGQTPGGRYADRGLATRRAYRYDPITTRDTFPLVSDTESS